MSDQVPSESSVSLPRGKVLELCESYLTEAARDRKFMRNMHAFKRRSEFNDSFLVSVGLRSRIYTVEEMEARLNDKPDAQYLAIGEKTQANENRIRTLRNMCETVKVAEVQVCATDYAILQTKRF